MTLNGFSGTPTNIQAVDDIIDALDRYGLNCYRISFTPTWTTGSRPYRPEYVDHFLANCSHTIIIDRNHHTSHDTVDWAEAEAALMECLERWGNNPSVILELVNEFVHDGENVWERCEPIVSRIKAASYTNKLLINKHTLANDWRTIGCDYYGHHAYFSNLNDPTQQYQTLWQAKAQMNNAIAAGCVPLVNTETGAHHREANHFTAENVAILNEYLAWCKFQGIGNMVWMNRDLNNLPRYEELGLKFSGDETVKYRNEGPTDLTIYKRKVVVTETPITIPAGGEVLITLELGEILVQK